MLLIPLKRLMDNNLENIPNQMLSRFACKRNQDVERFLRSQAIEYEKRNRARTFLVFPNKSSVEIVAYFSIALTVLELPNSASKSLIKNCDGASAFDSQGNLKTRFPCYLIGQLGKDDSCPDEITGTMLINRALSEIEEARNVAAGRIVVLDCKQIDGLVRLYESNGFRKLPNDVTDDLGCVEFNDPTDLIRMYKFLK